MKAVFAFLILPLIYAADSFHVMDTVLAEWNTFKVKYDKKYHLDFEERLRFSVFMDNRKKIALHNRKYELGEVTFTLEMNKFGDLTRYEYAKRVNGFNRTARAKKVVAYEDFNDHEDAAAFVEPANIALPAEVDWRKQGAVTPVKDQGMCGSCWAFSATGSLEGQHFRHKGSLVSLSEQNLIDCSGRFGNDGCDGGLMDNAFKYVKANHGIDTEQGYPYEAEDDACRYNPKKSGADDAGYVDLPKFNETKLQVAVATVGPISVAIDADTTSFQFYKKGIYYEPDCTPIDLDHGVLVVGYGTEAGKDFWIVKNSWGEDWGDAGYIKMSRNRHNNCGIASWPSYPLVK